MATHSSTLAWRIPWTEEPGRLESIALQSQTGLKQLSMHVPKSRRTYRVRTTRGIEEREESRG